MKDTIVFKSKESLSGSQQCIIDVGKSEGLSARNSFHLVNPLTVAETARKVGALTAGVEENQRIVHVRICPHCNFVQLVFGQQLDNSRTP